MKKLFAIALVALVAFSAAISEAAPNPRVRIVFKPKTSGSSVEIEVGCAWTESYFTPKLFSVSADKKVYFTRSNVISASKSLTSFYIGEHQWEGVEIYTDEGSQYTSWASLTGSTASSCNSSTTYSGPVDIFGELSVLDGDKLLQVCRVLSKEEWNYLLKSRQDAESKNMIATLPCLVLDQEVKSVSGLLLLPDEYDGPVNTNPDMETWYEMEAAGAVFLPESKATLASDMISRVSYSGAYWTTSTFGDFSILLAVPSTETEEKLVDDHVVKVPKANYGFIFNNEGASVRLVTEDFGFASQQYVATPVESLAFDVDNGIVEVYDIMGRKVSDTLNLKAGFYLVKKNGSVSKIVVR